MELLSVGKIGRQALDILDRVGCVKIQGITSRGVFLETDVDWMMFLSGEAFSGPLTLNTPNVELFSNRFKLRSKGKLIDKLISFEDLNLGFCLSDADVWEPVEVGEISEELLLSGLNMIKTVPDPMLGAIIRENQGEITVSLPLFQKICQITEGVRNGDFDNALQAAKGLLGRGVGLTPEGDDFFVGFLLQLRIAKNVRNLDLQLEEYSQEICRLATQMTTKLSANLIGCASIGQVDERISNLVQALYLYPNELDSRIDELLRWGNTSGRMVLAGIIAGMLTELG